MSDILSNLDKAGLVRDARAANLRGPFIEQDVSIAGPDGIVSALNYALHTHTRTAAVDERIARRRLFLFGTVLGVLFGASLMFAAGLLFFHPVNALIHELHEASAASNLLREIKK